MFQRLRIQTAGESHGPALTGLLEGLPAGIFIDQDWIQLRLKERQSGFGRSGRQKIETDTAIFLGGVYKGLTTGAPIAIQIPNVDQSLFKESQTLGSQTPRAGHADLPGMIKYGFQDAVPILERASARETALRVAFGSVAECLLKEFSIQVVGRVVRVGSVASEEKIPFSDWRKRVVSTEFRCGDLAAEEKMREVIVEAARLGDTLGGHFQIAVLGLVPGLGSHVGWQTRLDARLSAAMLSIPAIKGIEFGMGFKMGEEKGSSVHDVIGFDPEKKPWGYVRETNRAGGIEGGMTNGEPVWFTCVMKPLSSLRASLNSVDVRTKQRAKAPAPRSDVTAVASACVVAEAMAALVIADAFLEKFGGDSLEEIRHNYKGYLSHG